MTTNETALREARHTLNEFEQMKDAESQCAPCKLCGGKAIISDAGPGSGYYVRCSGHISFRTHTGCMIDGCRTGGWAYNVMEWWNRLHAQYPSQPVVAEAVVDRVADAMAADNDREVMFMRGDNAEGWRQLARVAIAAHPQASPPPVQTDSANLRTIFNIARSEVRNRDEMRTALSLIASIAEKELTRLAHSQPDTQEGGE